MIKNLPLPEVEDQYAQKALQMIFNYLQLNEKSIELYLGSFG